MSADGSRPEAEVLFSKGLNLKSPRQKTYEKCHFGLMNVTARLFGISVCLGGAFSIYKGIYELIDTGSYASLVVGCFMILVGVAFLFAKPSRPDLDGYLGTKSV